MISSPEAVASLEEVDEERSLADLRAALKAPVDLIIAEGFKTSGADRIEISRGEGSQGLSCPEQELVAVISDRQTQRHRCPFSGWMTWRQWPTS